MSATEREEAFIEAIAAFYRDYETLDHRTRARVYEDAMAEAFALCEAMKIYNWRMAWGLEQGQPSPAEASAAKVFGTEVVVDIYRLLVEVVGDPVRVRSSFVKGYQQLPVLLHAR